VQLTVSKGLSFGAAAQSNLHHYQAAEKSPEAVIPSEARDLVGLFSTRNSQPRGERASLRSV